MTTYNTDNDFLFIHPTSLDKIEVHGPGFTVLLNLSKAENLVKALTTAIIAIKSAKKKEEERDE